MIGICELHEANAIKRCESDAEFEAVSMVELPIAPLAQTQHLWIAIDQIMATQTVLPGLSPWQLC
ncbi:hypothetical protein [Leptolyngbya sp. FACHB-711]|uniref:hypothetical protein n=1 Tax=Leptolyngbya sp. FACHB-711 TaxID=2692813 RepID=UPI00168893DB|nr:hypothetical protein [Leptolyngbya sp. FACHB-711]MBD1853757.1 hypothetical protein [Cyanobacteria bacterium FACHB-502]MBD2026507.1 hypothetical protein [Leptolyngbya sp. FACHB-711]